jgi:hypothetical protein
VCAKFEDIEINENRLFAKPETATNNELPEECDVALIQEGAMYPKGLKDSSADCAM